MKRRGFIALLGGPAALPLIALLRPLLAATPSWSANDKSPARIGWLKIQGARHTPGQLQAFREGMRAYGLVEGRDYVLERVTRMVTRPGCPVSRQSYSSPASVSSWQQVSLRLQQPRV